MWLSQHQSVFTELVQSTLVRLCTEHVPYDVHLELDGLLCISSDTSGARQIVIKIHKVIGSSSQQSLENDGVAKCAPKPATFLDHYSFPSTAAPVQIVEVPPIPINGMNRAIGPRPGNDTSSPVELKMPPSKELHSFRTSDVRMQAWKQRAPQILKLLAKSEMSSISRNQLLLPTDLSRSASVNSIKTNVIAANHAKKDLDDDKIEDLTLGTPHSGNKWRCKICHIHCMSFGDLELHMRSEHVRFVCRLCLNSFTLSCNLRRHMKLHAGVRPHICSHCSATFSRSTDLKIHMKKHTDMRSDRVKNETPSPGTSTPSSTLQLGTPMTGRSSILHECDICNKGFAIASHLADHQQTHSQQAVKLEDGSVTDGNGSTDGEKSGDCEDMSTEQEQFVSPYCNNQTLDLRSSSSGAFSQPSESATDNGDAMDFSVDLSVKVPLCVSDADSTMRELGPLFDLPDSRSADQVKSNGDSEPVNMTAAVAKAMPPRSKRKGLPVKRIDMSSDDNEDALTDDSGAVVHDVFPMGDDTNGHESTPSQSGHAQPCSPSVCTPVEEDEPICQPQTVLDAKVYTCQYTGGCGTTWFGFSAYERHYTTAHGGRYPCPLCPQSFTSRNNRRRHADGHAGSPGSTRHQCSSCGKLFARADISKEHRLTHTKSYQLGACTKCGDTGGNKRSSLLLHLKRCLAYVDIDKDIDDAECSSVA